MISVLSKNKDAYKIIDNDNSTTWISDKSKRSSNKILIDLGKTHSLKGFTYIPMQGRWPYGIVSHYEFSVSTNNKIWRTVATGEFGNIKNSPIEQTVPFTKTNGRYIKLKGIKIVDNDLLFSAG